MRKPAARPCGWIIGAAALLAATTASAHVTIFPKQSLLGESQKYMMRVPNEKKVATIRVEGEFPAELKVSALEEKPGWTVEPRRNAAGDIVGGVWSGNLPVEGFVEFGITAANPAQGTDMTWKFVQFYEDGSKVEWAGPKGSRTPAPVVALFTTLPPPADTAKVGH